MHARPIITPSAPVSLSSTCSAFSGLRTSPLANTGISTASLISRMVSILGIAPVAAGSCAPMNRQCSECPHALRDARYPRPVAVLLDSTRYASSALPVRSTAVDHGVENSSHEVFVAQQRGTGQATADFLRRATHVDVDDLGAAVRPRAAQPAPSPRVRSRRSAPRAVTGPRRSRVVVRSWRNATGSRRRSSSRWSRGWRPTDDTGV